MANHGVPRRVAIVHGEGDRFFGSERVAIHAARALREQNDRVAFFVDSDENGNGIIQDAGFPVARLDLSYRTPVLPWQCVPQMARAFRAIRVHETEFVHCTSIAPLPVILPAARMAGIPVVAQIQASYTDEQLDRSLCMHADLLMPATSAVETRLAEFLVQKGRRDLTRRLHQVRPFVAEYDPDAAKRGDELRRAHRIGEDEALVGMLGDFEPSKGADLFIEALGMVAGNGLRPKAWIAGRDPDPTGAVRRELERIACDSGVSAQVRFFGHVEDLPAYYAALDILVVPSRLESLDFVAGGALVGGAAVVATETGLLPDLIVNEKTGLLVPPSQPEMISDGVFRLLVDADLRKRLAVAGREHVERDFSRDAFVRSLLHGHERACRRAPGKPFGGLFNRERPEFFQDTFR